MPRQFNHVLLIVIVQTLASVQFYSVDADSLTIDVPSGTSLIVYEGEPFALSCLKESNKTVHLVWQWKPSAFQTTLEINSYTHPPDLQLPIEEVREYNDNKDIWSEARILRWLNITKKASGTYFCFDSVDNGNKVIQSFYVNVTGAPALLATKPSKNITIGQGNSKEKLKIQTGLVSSGSRFKLSCNVSGTASATNSVQYEWILSPSETYKEDEAHYYYENQVIPLRKRTRSYPAADGRSWVLEVRNASYLDTGLYTCVDLTRNRSIVFQQYVYVRDKMEKILPTREKKINKETNVKAVIVFLHRKGPIPLGCGQTDPSVTIDLFLDDQRKKLATSKNTSNDAVWTFNPLQGFQLNAVNSLEDFDGVYVCLTEDQSKQRRFRIKVFGVELKADHGQQELTESDKLVLTCKGKTIDEDTSPVLTWLWKPNSNNSLLDSYAPLTDDVLEGWDCTQEENHGSYYSWSRITCEKTPLEAAGSFECRDDSDENTPAATYHLTVLKAVGPLIEGGDNETVTVDPSSSVTLECIEKGSMRPVTSAKWYVNNGEGAFKKDANYTKTEGWQQISSNSNLYQIRMVRNFTSELAIQKADNSSIYVCELGNFKGVARKAFFVKIRSQLDSQTIAIISVSVVVALVLLPLVIFFVIYRLRQKNNSGFRQSLKDLLEGNLSQINPNSPLDGQVELLPYDSKWEFPECSLFLEKQIGFGYFGRVVKARAIGISPPSESETEVAVKMVKSRSDLLELKSLVCELKILVHLASHLNVVNLLGAVTKNIEKGTLMVIVEYCRNGNLKDYLISNRSAFVNELDDDGNIKSSRAVLKGYQNVRKSTDDISTDAAASAITLQFEGAQVKRKLHKKFSSRSGETRCSTITTSDLMEWSYEIAAGMNYLTKKKVIHGDLAARNVLLADDNVVKIADFGLARKFYQDSNYYKTGNEALPVKWMAIESLKDRVFSSKSDVWSFGVTLWELFSLGQEPYAEVDSSILFRYLSSGGRMSKPEHAPNIIGDLMSSCWKANPDERPSFERYEQALGSLLEPELLALYKMPYDRFGYIITNDSSETVASEDELQDQDIAHDYLQLKRSNESQAASIKLDSVLPSTPSLLFSEMSVKDASVCRSVSTVSNALEVTCL